MGSFRTSVNYNPSPRPAGLAVAGVGGGGCGSRRFAGGDRRGRGGERQRDFKTAATAADCPSALSTCDEVNHLVQLTVAHGDHTPLPPLRFLVLRIAGGEGRQRDGVGVAELRLFQRLELGLGIGSLHFVLQIFRDRLERRLGIAHRADRERDRVRVFDRHLTGRPCAAG